MNKSINSSQWTPVEDATAIQMRADGFTDHEIGDRLRRSRDGVRNRLYWLAKTPEERKEHSRTRKRTARKPEAVRAAAYRHVPEEVVADRQRRLLAPRSITSLICGDPEIGRSALCQKRMEGRL